VKFKILTIATIIFLYACNNGQVRETRSKSDTFSNNHVVDSTAFQQTKYLRSDRDSIIVDPFEIEIELTDKAKERITSTNETIIISIFYYGYPKDEKDANSENDGTLYLATAEKEISYGQIARFENVKISKNDYDKIIDKDFDLNLTVYSGRKSSQDNLLNCQPLFDKVSNVANKRFTLKGKLIFGDE
jgi:hypothetical protein